MMVRLFQRFLALALLLGMASCAQLSPQSTSNGAASAGLSKREAGLIQQQLVSKPLPNNPKYVKVRQACFFCVTHPEDGSMVPVGMLKPDVFIVLRRVDGEWLDVQLSGGQLGSVIGSNIREITPKEDTSKEYLAPQPDLEPLSLPQVDASMIDTTLLGS